MNSRTPSFLLPCLLSVVLMGFASGCSWSVGGSKTTSSPATTSPTLGQELIDLKSAHDQGVISDAEYDAARKRLLAE